MPHKERIDKLLVDRGLADSRTRAQAMIMAGIVLADERRIDKPAEKIEFGAIIRLKGVSAETKYASRGGLKLEAALNEFHIDVAGMRCIDVGASTGGFTDCLLQAGARSVTAIDAGTNQLVWSLRQNPRVIVREKTNARWLRSEDFPDKFDLAVMDVSFISVTKVIPAIVPLLSTAGRLVVLIKPQFEVGPGEVGKGGIVRDADKRERVVREVNEYAESIGLRAEGLIESPILGAEGNKEFLALYAAERAKI